MPVLLAGAYRPTIGTITIHRLATGEGGQALASTGTRTASTAAAALFVGATRALVGQWPQIAVAAVVVVAATVLVGVVVLVVVVGMLFFLL